jgi:hypothetical protein
MGVSTTEMNSNMWSNIVESGVKTPKIKYQNQIMTVWVETTDMYWSEYTTFSGNFVIFY